MFRKSTILAAFVIAAPPAMAQDGAATTPPSFQSVVDCRAVVGEKDRLACYDRTVEAMVAARAADELVVTDRTTIDDTRKKLFGITLPGLKLLGKEAPLAELESQVRELGQDVNRKWVFTLTDGARWKQVDTRVISPAKGDPIRIRRAALGSYMANVGSARAIRVMRVVN